MILFNGKAIVTNTGGEPLESDEVWLPDTLTHAFRTYLGLPASKGDAPVCGAILTDAYDFPGVRRPVCPECAEILREWRERG